MRKRWCGPQKGNGGEKEEDLHRAEVLCGADPSGHGVPAIGKREAIEIKVQLRDHDSGADADEKGLGREGRVVSQGLGNDLGGQGRGKCNAGKPFSHQQRVGKVKQQERERKGWIESSVARSHRRSISGKSSRASALMPFCILNTSPGTCHLVRCSTGGFGSYFLAINK